MVKFYNTVGSAALTNWAQGSNQQIAFGRGTSGFVVINNEDGAWTKTFATSLPNARYCDAIAGGKGFQGCTGGRYVDAWPRLLRVLTGIPLLLLQHHRCFGIIHCHGTRTWRSCLSCWNQVLSYALFHSLFTSFGGHSRTVVADHVSLILLYLIYCAVVNLNKRVLSSPNAWEFVFASPSCCHLVAANPKCRI